MISSFSSRTPRIIASTCATPLTAIVARAAASSSPALSAIATAKGSCCIGETQAPRTTGVGTSEIGSGISRALRFAIATALRAASPTDLLSSFCVAANPHAPSASTRTPRP